MDSKPEKYIKIGGDLLQGFFQFFFSKSQCRFFSHTSLLKAILLIIKILASAKLKHKKIAKLKSHILLN